MGRPADVPPRAPGTSRRTGLFNDKLTISLRNKAIQHEVFRRDRLCLPLTANYHPNGQAMEKKGRTKRQHYVPRFILRKFSQDERRLSVLTLHKGTRIAGAPIATQCYADYFYGADNTLENAFAAEESKIATLLGDLSTSRLSSLSAQDLHDLRLFTYYQKMRTLGAAKHTSTMLGAIVTGDEATEIGSDSQHDTLRIAPKCEYLVQDLELKFIITERDAGFVIADNPVVSYNQFVEHHPVLRRWPTSTALALKGIQLFLPVSPNVILALYDPEVYSYGGKSCICRAGPADIAHLNRMQAVNAVKALYFHDDRIDDSSLDDLQNARSRHSSIYRKPVIDVEGTDVFIVTHVDVRVGAKLAFVRTLDGHSYEEYDRSHIPIRASIRNRI